MRRALPLLAHNSQAYMQVLSVVAVAVLLAATATTSQAAKRTAVTARDYLSSNETLRGTMTFTTPSGWRETAKSGSYTRQFAAREREGCTVALSLSIRGKATKRSAAAQVRAALGEGAGSPRRDGAYGSSLIADRAGHRTVYAIAVVRVARRRFGQLRIFATYRGSGCSPYVAEGRVGRQIRRVLRDARSHLRVGRR